MRQAAAEVARIQNDICRNGGAAENYMNTDPTASIWRMFDDENDDNDNQLLSWGGIGTSSSSKYGKHIIQAVTPWHEYVTAVQRDP